MVRQAVSPVWFAALLVALTSSAIAQQEAPEREEYLSNTRLPLLNVTTLGPKVLVVGKQSIYSISVSNVGDYEAQNILVQLTLPEGLDVKLGRPTTGNIRRQSEENAESGTLLWNITSIPPQRSAELPLAVIPTSGRPFDFNVRWGVEPIAAATPIRVLEPKVSLKLSGPESFVYGETATFIATIGNPGDGDAENVVLTLEGGDVTRVGTIPPGEQRQIELKIAPRSEGNGTVRTTVAADPGLNAAQELGYLVRRSQLKVDVSGPQLDYASATVNYHVQVANNGNADAENVVVQMLLPEGMEYAGEVDGIEKTETGLTWQTASLQAGGKYAVDIPCLLTTPGDKNIQILADDPQQESHAAGEIATAVRSIADLKLTVHDTPGPRPVGTEVSYKIFVTNRGTKEARGVRVTATGTQGVRITDFTGNAAVKGSAIEFDAVDILPAGKTAIFEMRVKGIASGSHPMYVKVNCGSPETQLLAQESTQFFERRADENEANRAPLATPGNVRR